MKRILIVFMFIGTFAQAQQEIKLDVINPLVMKSIGASYELYLNEETSTSVGISFLYDLSKDDVNFRYNEKLVLAPYFRYYIPMSSSNNFRLFGELFLGINKGRKKNKEKSTEENTIYDKYTDGALGIGGGLKYVSPQGFVFEAHAGVGRNLFSEKSIAVVPRLGLSIGYRF